MKKILIALAAVITLIACKKNDDNSNTHSGNFLTKVTVKTNEGSRVSTYTIVNGKLTGSTHQEYNDKGIAENAPEINTYSYENGRIIKWERTRDNKKDFIATFEYDQKGNLIKDNSDFLNEQYPLSRYVNTQYFYEGSRLVKEIEKFTAINGTQTDTHCNEITYSYINNGNTVVEQIKKYKLDTAGNIITNTISSGSTATYTLSGGSVVKIDNSGAELQEITYDNKHNPYLSHNIAVLEPTSVFASYSDAKNNPTQIILTNSSGKTTTRCEYKYNAQNFPISVKAYVKENDNSEKLVSEAQLEYGS